MTTPGGSNEEIASLLLRVAVDYEALQSFVETLPVIPEVLEAVSAQINQTQVGSAALFREKGAALARAFVAGYQAEALGLNFGSIPDQITRQVFGQLDFAQFDRYREQIESLYAAVRQQVPQVTTPLIDQSSIQGLRQISEGAYAGSSAVQALTSQLGVLRGELAALQNLTLPRTLVRRNTAGDVEYTPAAQRALAPLRQTFPDGLPEIEPVYGRRRGRGEQVPNVLSSPNIAETNRNIERLLQRELDSSRAFIERVAVPNTERLTQVVAPAALPTIQVEAEGARTSVAGGTVTVRVVHEAIGPMTVDRDLGRYTQLVSVDVLRRYMEYDRSQPLGAGGTPDSRAIIDAIKEGFARGEGLREPVTLSVGKDGNRHFILQEEGNHRLAAAIEAGLTAIPAYVQVVRRRGLGSMDPDDPAVAGVIHRPRPLDLRSVPADSPLRRGTAAGYLRPDQVLREGIIEGNYSEYRLPAGYTPGRAPNYDEFVSQRYDERQRRIQDAARDRLPAPTFAPPDAFMAAVEQFLEPVARQLVRPTRPPFQFSADPRDDYGDQVFRVGLPSDRLGVHGPGVGYMRTGRPNFVTQIEGIAVEPEYQRMGVATELFRFAQQWRRQEALREGIDPFINQIFHDPSRTEAGEAFARRAGGFARGRDGGINLMLPTGEVPFPDPLLPNFLRREFRARPELPVGTGVLPTDYGALEREEQALVAQQRRAIQDDLTATRIARIAARRNLELLEESEAGAIPGRTRLGLTVGGPLDTSPRVSSPLERIAPRVVNDFTRRINEDVLRMLDVMGSKDSQTANSADITPESLRRALGGPAYERMIMGQGLGPVERLRLSEEQREALGDTNAVRPQGRLYPGGLIDRGMALRGLIDPDALGPLATPWVPSQRMITAGTPFDDALAPVRRVAEADRLAQSLADNARRRAMDFSGLPTADQAANMEALRQRAREQAPRQVRRPLAELAAREALAMQAMGGMTPDAYFARQQLASPFGLRDRHIIPSDPGTFAKYAGFFQNDDGTRRRRGQLNYEYREDLGGSYQGRRYNSRLELPPGAMGQYEINPRTGQEQRIRGYAVSDGRGGGLLALSTGQEHHGFNRDATHAHELQHILPHRNPQRFRERMAGSLWSAGAEEGRADALSGRNMRFPYPNISGDPRWQEGYDHVHRRISEANAYREAALRAQAGQQAMLGPTGGILEPGVPPRMLRAGEDVRSQHPDLRFAAEAEAAARADMERLQGGLARLQSNPEQAAALSAVTGRDELAAAMERVARAEAAHAQAAAALAAAETNLAREVEQAAAPVRRLPFVAGAQGAILASGETGLVPVDPIGAAQRALGAVASRYGGGAYVGQPMGPAALQAARAQMASQFYRSALPGGVVHTPRFGPFGPGGAAGAHGAYGPGNAGGPFVPPPGFIPPPPFVPGGGGGAGAGGPGGPFPGPGPMPGPGPGGPGAAGGLFAAFRGGVRSGVLGGATTPDEMAQSLGRTVGSALKFSIAYGAAYSALRLLTGSFGHAVQETVQFEQALTDLNIATERTGRSNENFARSLSNLGAGAGVGPAEAVAAGARAIGLFDVTEGTQAEKEAVARQSLDTSRRLAFMSPGTSLEAIQTQVAGISRSFNIGAMDQERVADVASFIGRRTGRPGAEILSSLGQIGSLGESAGFDLEQVAAIIARLTSTTGQTPQAVSGFLSQVLSRADDPRLQERLRAVGVNTTGTTLAQQIEQLSGMNLGREQTNQIVQAFGRGRSGQALGIILEQFPEIQSLAGGARTESAGLAQRDFEQAVNTVGGQLRTLSADIKDLFVGLASSGILDPLVAMLSLVGGVVDALDYVVDAFSLIPREARTAGFAILSLVAALNLLSRFGPGLNAAAAAGLGTIQQPMFRRGAAVMEDVLDADGNVIGQRQRTRTQYLGGPIARGRAVAGAGLAGAQGLATSALTSVGGTAVGSAVGGALGVGAAAAGGIVLGAGAVLASGILGVAAAVDEAREVTRLGIESGIAVNTATTVQELDAALIRAEEFKRVAEDRDDFELFSSDIFSLGIGNVVDEVRGGSQEQRDQAEAQIAEIERRREEMEAEAQRLDPFSTLGNFASVEAVSQGLQELSERGYTAAQQLAMVNQAFDGLLEKTGAAGAVAVLQQGQGREFSGTLAEQLIAGADTARKPLLTGEEGANGFAGGVADFWRSSPLGVVTSPLEGVAGAFGRMAGASGPWYTKGDDFLKGGWSAFSEAGQEFNPLATSDREQAEENREAAERFGQRLADPALREKLAGGVTDVLNELNLNPDVAGGPVSLGPDDIEAIKERQLQILKATLGEDFDNLPKDVREQYERSLVESITAAAEGFGGTEVTAANGRAYLQSVVALADRAGAELALTSGSPTAGAALERQRLEEGRGKILDSVARYDQQIAAATDPAEREQLSAERDRQLQLLAAYDLIIRQAIVDESAAMRQDIQVLAEYRKSGLMAGDVQGGLFIDIQAIDEQLALDLPDNDRLALEGQRRVLERQQAQDFQAARAADALNDLPVRAGRARTQQELASANERLETLAFGQVDYENTVDQINQLNDNLALYALDLAAATDQLGINPANSAALNDATLADANRRVTDALATEDPLLIAQARRAQEVAAYQANRVDPVALDAARRRASINPGNELANARADVDDARAQLGLYDRDTQEWYEAQRRLREAELNLSSAQAEQARRLRRLGTDLTDPLAQARQDVQDAIERLNEARAQGGDTSQEQLDLRNTQNNAEAIAFQQRFSDAQTAEELGRISHSAYLRYLDSEHDRLTAIHNRTRQQQEQLDQVDRAIKAAKDGLDQQFNFGEINLPTVYEVRRAMKTPASMGYNPQQTVNIEINGSDLNEIVRVVSGVVGTNLTTSASRTGTRPTKVGL